MGSKNVFVAAFTFLSLVVGPLGLSIAHGQIEIKSLRLVPSPQVFGVVNWFLVDFDKGEIQEIELTTKWQVKFGPLAQSTVTIPIPSSVKGKESGTLKIPHVWQERPDADDLRTIVVELRDKKKNMSVRGKAFTPAKGWEAGSPIKLLSASVEQNRPQADGTANTLRISYEVNPKARPELLYVEIDEGDGRRDIEEIRIAQEERTTGQVRWTWPGTRRGQRQCRIWMVDEQGNQTNALDLKLAL